ncbi:MAG: hypothetical protein WBI57_17060 [Desulfobacterales bacterium]
MWNVPSKKRLAKIPGLYETEHIPLQEKLIYLYFFIGNCSWFIAEHDGDDLFWGFAHLGDDVCAEWGMISFKEMKDIKIKGFLEIDCELEEHWKVRPAKEIEAIRIANGWPKEKNAQQKTSKKDELVMKVRAGHFKHFQDLFAEVTSPCSDFYGIDPNPIWEVAHEHGTN